MHRTMHRPTRVPAKTMIRLAAMEVPRPAAIRQAMTAMIRLEAVIRHQEQVMIPPATTTIRRLTTMMMIRFQVVNAPSQL